SAVDNPYSMITFGDLVGKLGRVRIGCAKCGRRGQYRLAVLIGKYGRDKKLFAWIDELTETAPIRRTPMIRATRAARICPSGYDDGRASGWPAVRRLRALDLGRGLASGPIWRSAGALAAIFGGGIQRQDSVRHD